jgi:hypothetical protein
LHHDVVAIVVAAVLAVTIAQLIVQQPSRVDVTVVNETPYQLRIEAAGEGDSSWFPVMVVDPRETRERTGSVDQGELWRLQFAGQGRRSGEITVSRDELEADGWRLVVPPSVVEDLERQGATPPPPR